MTAVTTVAGLVRGVRFLTPLGELGDEQVYASNACWYAHSSKAICGLAREGNLEHPPLGKWIMSLPMHIWGYTPFSQRILSVVFGTLTVALLYLLARLLLRSTLGATIAAGGLAVDFMAIVHSRVAMLDIYLLFFVVLAFVFLVLDRNRLFEKGRSGGTRPWRLAAGAAAGAAIATKWTGLLTLFAIAFLSFAWEDHRRRDRKKHLLVTLAEQGPSLFLTFVLVPMAVYATTFVGHVRGALVSWPWIEGSWLNALWERQAHIFSFHAQLIWEHQSASPPWSWPLAKRGAPFIYTPGDSIRTVVDTGNPVIWTLSIVVLIYIAFRWARRQDPREPEGVLLGGFVWAYPPWLVYSLVPFLFFTWDRSALFIWYLLPALPFMYMALGYVAMDLVRKKIGRVVVAGVALFAVASLAFYYPVLTYAPLSRGALDARMFAFDNCERRDHAPFIYFKKSTVNGSTRFEKVEEPAAPHLTPLGWCWLP
ncbi:MAG TPA: phospholipid carrier-dependent glycosyltransferase [Actinomycetota bacterium]|nr:phospholipid carrier-dependent glycosyltransferase [Actinomycetota bacterium]